MIQYNAIVESQTVTAIKAIEREQAAAIEALDHDADNFVEMEQKVMAAYNTKLQKAKNELYVKDVDERMAIELAGEELINQKKQAMLDNDLSNRRISMQDYIQESISMEVEALQQ